MNLVSFVDTIITLLPTRYQKLATQFAKFAVTGAIGAVVDFSTYNILTRLFDWHTTYTMAGLNIIAANLVSVSVAISSNFLLNKYWTFKDRTSGLAKQGANYFIFNFFTFVLNQVVTSVLVFQVPLMNIFGSQKDNIAKALAIGIILSINFLGSKLFIFRKPQAPLA